MKEAVPTVAATIATQALSIAAGATAEAKVTVKRTYGFKSKLMLAAKALPDGVSAPEVEVPEKDGDVTLKITAEMDAAPSNQPLQLTLREVDSGVEHPVLFYLIAPGESNGVTQGYTKLVIDSTDLLWLTVQKASAATEKSKANTADTK
jgi:hypothetical protein